MHQYDVDDCRVHVALHERFPRLDYAGHQPRVIEGWDLNVLVCENILNDVLQYPALRVHGRQLLQNVLDVPKQSIGYALRIQLAIDNIQREVLLPCDLAGEKDDRLPHIVVVCLWGGVFQYEVLADVSQLVLGVVY